MKRLVLPMCLLILIGLVSVVLAAAGVVAAASPAQAPAGDASRGKTLFLDNCVLCHGPNGNGKGPNAATFNPPPASFKAPKFWSDDVPKKLRNAVKNGKGLMPPVKTLTSDDIRDITAYVTQTFKPATAK